MSKERGSRLDKFSMSEVLPYINSSDTLLKVMMTTKKFEHLNEWASQNPYDIIRPIDKKMFSHINTLVFYTPDGMFPYYKELKEVGDKSMEEDREKCNIGIGADISKIDMRDVHQVMRQKYPKMSRVRIRLNEKWREWRADGEGNKRRKLRKFMKRNDEGNFQKRQWVKVHREERQVKLPAEWRRIPKYCFNHTWNQEVWLSTSCVLTERRSFYECWLLRKVVIPKSVKILGEETFYECRNLKEVKFEGGSELKEIQERCFSFVGITEIRIPDGCETLQTNVFKVCPLLTHVYLPRALKVVNTKLFEGCTSLTTISLPERFRNFKFLDVSQTIQFNYY